MISEWLKVMLEEISRKKTEAEQARIDERALIEERERIEGQTAGDEQRRREEPGCAPRSGPNRARG
jgi:hypothetical protein